MTPLSPLFLHYKEQRLEIIVCSGKGQQLENRVEISLPVRRQDQGILLLLEVKKETKLYTENEMCIHCYHFIKGNLEFQKEPAVSAEKNRHLVKVIFFFPADIPPPLLNHTSQQTPSSCLPF